MLSNSDSAGSAGTAPSMFKSTTLALAGQLCLLFGCATTEKAVQLDKPDLPATAETSEEPPGVIEVIENHSPDGVLLERFEGYRNAEEEFVKHGPSTTYHANGRKRLQMHYSHGVLHGPRINWYDSGQMSGRGYYNNGREDGTWDTWWPNGFKQREFHMVDGAFYGLFTEWHSNGEKKVQYEYVRGRKQGTFTIWDEQGDVAYQSEYVDDVEQP